MSSRTGRSRTQLWLDGLGDWSWPGLAAERDFMPPSWVPAMPRLEPALAGISGPATHAGLRPRAWRLALAMLLGLAAIWCGAALAGRAAWLESLVRAGSQAAVQEPPAAGATRPPPSLLPALPRLEPVARDRAGSAIERAAYGSRSLGRRGSFLVYLPPGYESSQRRYPVLYMLHGRDGHADAFLEIGIQATLDRLIAAGRTPPMIAVMIQDQHGLNNWRDVGARHSATYVVEVQELADRMLRTVPARASRAIAGSSMGGFGAMNIALANPLRFSVVESWLGFFDGLYGSLHADEQVIRRLGMQAFLYGAAEDPVAVPAENPEFAAALRAAGGRARSAIYPGGHSLGKVRAHLEAGLEFAGRSLSAAQRRAAAEAARPHAVTRERSVNRRSG